MSLRTLAAFLIGNREAIVTLADDRRTIWLGMFMVLSAGLAREYDAEYLLAEPWHLLIPFAGSLLASFLLHCLLNLVGKWETKAGFLSSYRAFLGVFWLTAPLAWAYAIPYERFLSDLGAVQANLWTLFFVAAWRVVLTIRVVSVLYGAPLRHAVFPVLLFSDTLALIGVQAVPFPLIAIMGGVRLEPGEAALRAAAGGVFCWGSASWGVWFLGTAWVANRARRALWRRPALEPGVAPPGRPWGAIVVTSAVIAILAVAMTKTQPEQALRYRVEEALAKHGFPAALEVLEGHAEQDFPPHWGLPRVWQRRAFSRPNFAELTHLLRALGGRGSWVRRRYLLRAAPEIRSALHHLLIVPPTSERPEGERDVEVEFLQTLASLPEGPALAAELQGRIAGFLQECKETPGVDGRYREALEALSGEAEPGRRYRER